MENNKEVLLKVENLEQWFRSGKFCNKAVDNVSFEVYKGEVFGLVGESGCGKTTTGRSIIRLYNITGGKVYFKNQLVAAGIRPVKEQIKFLGKDLKDGKISKEEYDAKVKELKEQISELKSAHKKGGKLKDVTGELLARREELKKEIKALNKDVKEKKLSLEAYEEKSKPLMEELQALNAEYKNADRLMGKMQMIFQDPIASLDPRMTVREIIAEGLNIRGIRDKKQIDEEVYKVLDLVGLVPEHAGRYPHEFSGGQRQRIGIARALVLNPELIIADEPISALDVSIQAQVINLLNELRHSLGLTILFIAHDLSVVKYFSDRIGVMYYGKMVELATSDELFAHPLHPYTRSLLSAIPLPDPRTEKTRVRKTYNPIAEHDYRVDGPQMREVAPGHFVYCNQAEFEKYQEELKK